MQPSTLRSAVLVIESSSVPRSPKVRTGSPSAELPLDRPGDEVVLRAQVGCPDVWLEDREQGVDVGEQETFAPLEDEEVPVPVVASRLLHRQLLWADHVEQLLRAPKDHVLIVGPGGPASRRGSGSGSDPLVLVNEAGCRHDGVGAENPVHGH